MSPKRTKVVEFGKSFVAKKPISASSIDVSASSDPRVDPMDEDRLREVLQRIVYYGEIKEAFHSAHERAYRNISQDDILPCLKERGRWRRSRSGMKRIRVGSTNWLVTISKATSWFW